MCAKTALWVRLGGSAGAYLRCGASLLPIAMSFNASPTVYDVLPDVIGLPLIYCAVFHPSHRVPALHNYQHRWSQ